MSVNRRWESKSGMAAYYNEIDPYAAQWLRNLIAAGHIAPGDVDERSIVDVRPDDLREYTQCHFFAGIGGWSLALRLAGFPDDRPVWTGSCPCQPFSAAGAGKAFDDARHLWPKWFPLIAQCKPAIVFGEQVEAAIGWGWLDAVFADLESEGYACGAAVLPACGVGAPHIRQRLWFVADADQRGFGIDRIAPERSERQPHPQQHLNDGELADATEPRCDGAGQHECVPPSQAARSEQRSGAGELGNADHAGLEERPSERSDDGSQLAPLERTSNNACTVGNAARDRQRQPRFAETGERRPGAVGRSGSRGDSAVGNPDSERENPLDGISGRPGIERARSPWADLDWLPCTDGKARPVESGTFPLAHGIPGRVGRLRAYGNAIVPQVAAEFIGASLDAIGECARMNAHATITDPILAEMIAAYAAREVFPTGHEVKYSDDSDERGRVVRVAKCECNATFRLLASREAELDAQVEAHWQRFDDADDRGQPVSEEVSRNDKPVERPDAGHQSASERGHEGEPPNLKLSTPSGESDPVREAGLCGGSPALPVSAGDRAESDNAPRENESQNLPALPESNRHAVPPAALPEPAGAQPSLAPASAGSPSLDDDDTWTLRLAETLAWRDEDEPAGEAEDLPIDETAIERPLLRWHGGKWKLAPWIMSHFPPHRVYVEPFGGAASILLRKPRSYAEVYNDLDDDAVNLFRVLRSDGKRLIELLRLTPFARTEFKASYEPALDPVERARSLVIRSFMGFGSNGHNVLRKTGFRHNSNRSGTTPAQDWANYPDALIFIRERLTGVVIDNRDACEVMSAHDEPHTLHYVDPPYMPETRALRNTYDLTYAGGMYRHEMTSDDHAKVLGHLLTLKGMVVLSGYPHKLYDSTLEGWRRVETPAHADGARDRTEVLWLNPACAAAVDAEHPTLFNIAKLDEANTPPLVGRDGG